VIITGTADFSFEKIDYLNGKHLIVATADVWNGEIFLVYLS
jgi:hypothetical protein